MNGEMARMIFHRHVSFDSDPFRIQGLGYGGLDERNREKRTNVSRSTSWWPSTNASMHLHSHFPSMGNRIQRKGYPIQCDGSRPILAVIRGRHYGVCRVCVRLDDVLRFDNCNRCAVRRAGTRQGDVHTLRGLEWRVPPLPTRDMDKRRSPCANRNRLPDLHQTRLP